MTVGGLAAATLAQQDDGLVLASGQEISVGSLGHAVNVRGSVLPPAALKHLHHLEIRKKMWWMGVQGQEVRYSSSF